MLLSACITVATLLATGSSYPTDRTSGQPHFDNSTQDFSTYMNASTKVDLPFAGIGGKAAEVGGGGGGGDGGGGDGGGGGGVIGGRRPSKKNTKDKNDVDYHEIINMEEVGNPDANKKNSFRFSSMLMFELSFLAVGMSITLSLIHSDKCKKKFKSINDDTKNNPASCNSIIIQYPDKTRSSIVPGITLHYPPYIKRESSSTVFGNMSLHGAGQSVGMVYINASGLPSGTATAPSSNHQKRDSNPSDQPYVMTVTNGHRKVSLTAENTGAMLHTQAELERIRHCLSSTGGSANFTPASLREGKRWSKAKSLNRLVPSAVITDTPPSSLWSIDVDVEQGTLDKTATTATNYSGDLGSSRSRRKSSDNTKEESRSLQSNSETRNSAEQSQQEQTESGNQTKRNSKVNHAKSGKPSVDMKSIQDAFHLSSQMDSIGSWFGNI